MGLDVLMPANTLSWHVPSNPIWRPPTDVFETEEAVIVRVEVAGMGEQDFTIALEERLLTIRGNRTDILERRAYHQMEIRFGEFGMQIELPVAVVADQIQAAYQDGFLKVILPKARPRNIKIVER